MTDDNTTPEEASGVDAAAAPVAEAPAPSHSDADNVEAPVAIDTAGTVNASAPEVSVAHVESSSEATATGSVDQSPDLPVPAPVVDVPVTEASVADASDALPSPVVDVPVVDESVVDVPVTEASVADASDALPSPVVDESVVVAPVADELPAPVVVAPVADASDVSASEARDDSAGAADAPPEADATAIEPTSAVEEPVVPVFVYQPGDIVPGVISVVGANGIEADLGDGAVAVIPRAELISTDEPTVGDPVEGTVTKLQTGTGRYVISPKRAARTRAWARITAAHESGEPVKGTVTSTTKGGLIVDLGIRGIPARVTR